MTSSSPISKLAALEERLRAFAPVALGFSGGVDSTFLAAVCARAIPDQTLLVHLDSPFVGTPERASFQGLVDTLGLPVLAIPFDPFIQEDVRANGPERCYHCKRAGFSRIAQAAQERGIACVLDGSNADDAAATDRPGTRALRELGVRSPLMETAWTKAEEREMLRDWGFPVWNLPAGACLATRVATGEPLTPAKLDAARACEDYLHELGCTKVRARVAEGGLRIEGSPQDLALIAVACDTAADGAASAHEGQPQLRGDVLAQLRALAQKHGIASVSPHARPYRRGSMNARP
ncbi:asparagine synthase-related protein [Collinsella intestinalis]|uniref:asparagine synthase-related protein n=1 Tax=Collinsella intestinalis TaxID=147207 RepID=UPI001958953C|nr:ATP-dependent sacrificial sulfur transferase LarE [Collinsella intestinalis]